jgi:hypothetical protein
VDGAYTAADWVTSPNIKALVNAWISRPGYVPGAKIGFILDGGVEDRWPKVVATDDQSLVYRGVNFASPYGTYAPRLDIETGGFFGPEIRCQVGGRKRAMLMGVA